MIDPLIDLGTAVNEDPSSSSKLSRSELNTRQNRRSEVSRIIYTKTFPDSTPPLLFQVREDSSSYALDDSPPVGIDVPFPAFEQKKPTKSDNLITATVDANFKLMKSNPGEF